MKFGVCVLTVNESGEILSVSRKDDKNDFGLPGGKIEPGETPIEAACRELYEETGYKVVDPRYSHLIYHAEDNGILTVVYEIPFGAMRLEATPTESGVVTWTKPETLLRGKTFGKFNLGLFKTIGIVKEDPYSNPYGGSSYKKKKA